LYKCWGVDQQSSSAALSTHSSALTSSTLTLVLVRLTNFNKKHFRSHNQQKLPSLCHYI
jgi:hypothetical protein